MMVAECEVPAVKSKTVVRCLPGVGRAVRHDVVPAVIAAVMPVDAVRVNAMMEVPEMPSAVVPVVVPVVQVVTAVMMAVVMAVVKVVPPVMPPVVPVMSVVRMVATFCKGGLPREQPNAAG